MIPAMRARILLPLAAALVACDPGPEPAAGAGPVVVASIHPIAAVVREVLPDGADVRALLPPGAHADTYEPTPRMAEAVADADLVVRVGGGLDEWLGSPGRREVVLAEGLRLHRGGSGHGAGNPHVWLDPILLRDHLLPRLVDALVATRPALEDEIRARADAFSDSLTSLHEEVERMLAGAATRRFVAAHPAWDYFAERYGLEQVGVLHPSPGEEIGTRELARLVRRARELGVRAVIAEPQLGRGGVAALADELNVRVEVADPIGGIGVEGTEEYLSLMRTNARAFARALGAA